MPIVRQPNRASLGGRPQRLVGNLRACMQFVGFDPAAQGCGWVLQVNDVHFDNTNNGQNRVIDPRVVAQLESMGSFPPDFIAVVGDVLTAYAPAFGWPADLTSGALEAGWANSDLHHLTDLAPVRMVLGNHDTPNGESPLGAYCLANIPDWFESTHWNETVGGVRFIGLSANHGGDVPSNQRTYFGQQLDALVANQDALVFVHQPAYGFASEAGLRETMLQEIAAARPSLTNRLWSAHGHQHVFSHDVFSIGSTTCVAFTNSATAPHVSSADRTTPSMTAWLCRNGQIVGAIVADLKEGAWQPWPFVSRAGAGVLTARTSGLGATVPTASYIEGSGYVRDFTTPSGPATWRDTGSWLAYVYSWTGRYVVPSGSTGFWILVSLSGAGSVALSADGVSWTTLTLGTATNQIHKVAIPAPLLSTTPLHVRILDPNGATLGGVGFY